MKTLNALKGNALRDEPVESVTLLIDKEIPCVSDGSVTLEQVENTHKDNAQVVMDALKQLPQGTRYQLLRIMLEDAKCYYVGA